MVSEVKVVAGRAVPVVGNDIDTDRIIPARFLKCVTFDGLGANAFADDRIALAGQHPFDLAQYQGATVLVVNGNFGCGSSREHAPQALNKWGIQAVVGESFSEIFFGNCVALGIPCVTVASALAKQLQEQVAANPGAQVRVDLVAGQVICEGVGGPIGMPEGVRQMFVSGAWDATGQLVAQAEQTRAIAAKLPYTSWSKAS
jgi:3-isopropylmalate/(R)-2-methylmalate dehydratase small subunit